MNYAIVLAAGSGTRMGTDIPKQFLDLAGRPVLAWTLTAFERADRIDRVILVVGREHVDACRAQFGRQNFFKVVEVVIGGAERQDSVANGLRAIPTTAGVVAVHDGARAYVTPEDIDAVVSAAMERGAAVLGTPVTDTIKRVRDDQIAETLDRSTLRSVQTPQAFRRDVICRAHRSARESRYVGTDEAALVERLGEAVVIVPGRWDNIKITSPEDLDLGMYILEQRGDITPTLRIGQGYDAHQLMTGRPLILGGVHIPHEKGLLGHSDADVLIHVVIDAVLGALGAGDIGRVFPDTDAAYKDISSLILLAQVGDILKKSHARIINVDATVMAQRPKLAPHIARMRENMARALDMPIHRVSVKATTTECMGFVGREEGMAAQAVALVKTSGK